MTYLTILMIGLFIPFAAVSQESTIPDDNEGIVAPAKPGRWYGGLEIGPASLGTIDEDGVEITFKYGLGFGVVFGYDTGRFRLEAEVSHQRNKFDEIAYPPICIPGQGCFGGVSEIDGDVSFTKIMANGWFKTLTIRHLTLYIGGGIGTCRSQYDIPLGDGLEATDSESDFAYQFGLWNSMPFGEAASLDLGYRYLATSPGDVDIGAHILAFRFRHNF